MLTDGLQWSDYTDASEPSNSSTLLAAAAATITRYCGWGIARQTVADQVFDGPGTSLLRLPTLALVSVTAVKVDDQAVTGYRASLLGMLERTDGSWWPEGFGRIKVSWVHGLDPVPDDVLQLAVSLALRAQDVTGTKTSETVGGMSTTYETRVDRAFGLLDQMVLDSYRLEPA